MAAGPVRVRHAQPGRLAMSYRATLCDAAAVADQDEGAHWLHGLTLALDQEPLLWQGV